MQWKLSKYRHSSDQNITEYTMGHDEQFRHFNCEATTHSRLQLQNTRTWSCKQKHAFDVPTQICYQLYMTLSNEKLTTQATKTVIWEHEGQMEHLVIQLNVIERYTQQH